MGSLSLDRAVGDSSDTESLYLPDDAPLAGAPDAPPVDFNLHPGEMNTAPPGPTASKDVLSDVFGHYTDPASPPPGSGGGGGGVGKALENLGKRDGLQADGKGVGFTEGDYKFRVWPYNDVVGPKRGLPDPVPSPDGR